MLLQDKQERFKSSLFKPNAKLLVILHIGGASQVYFKPEEVSISYIEHFTLYILSFVALAELLNEMAIGTWLCSPEYYMYRMLTIK